MPEPNILTWSQINSSSHFTSTNNTGLLLFPSSPFFLHAFFIFFLKLSMTTTTKNQISLIRMSSFVCLYCAKSKLSATAARGNTSSSLSELESVIRQDTIIICPGEVRSKPRHLTAANPIAGVSQPEIAKPRVAFTMAFAATRQVRPNSSAPWFTSEESRRAECSWRKPGLAVYHQTIGPSKQRNSYPG